MIEDKEIFDKEAMEPSYGEYKEDLVSEYLWLDSKTAKLYRYIHSDAFEKLPDLEKDDLGSQLATYKTFLKIVGDRARRNGLWDQIQNIIQ